MSHIIAEYLLFPIVAIAYIPFWVTESPNILFTLLSIPIYAAMLVPWVILTLAAVLVSRRTRHAPLIVLTSTVGHWLAFLSWVLSWWPIDAAKSTYRWAMDTPSDAAAGFPFRVLEIPRAALGGDVPPEGMWVGIMLNQLFWIAAGYFLAKRISAKWPIAGRKFLVLSTCIGFLGALSTIGAMLVWFD